MSVSQDSDRCFIHTGNLILSGELENATFPSKSNKSEGDFGLFNHFSESERAPPLFLVALGVFSHLMFGLHSWTNSWPEQTP